MRYKNKKIKHRRLQLLRDRRRHRKIKSKKKGKQAVIAHSKVGIPRSFRRNKSNRNPQRLIQRGRAIHKKREWLIEKYLPLNLKYLISEENGPFFIKSIKDDCYNSNGTVMVPEIFSIMDYPEQSYLFLRKIISALIIEVSDFVILNYENCKKVELSSQVLLDIILKDFWTFRKKFQHAGNKESLFPSTIAGININDVEIQKLLFSVGSPAVLNNRERKFEDIIPYKLCIHNNEEDGNPQKRIEQKEIDTTVMADYVIDCLRRMKKKLTGDKLNDLCTVIGEILINAEEHSTTKYRFSIGYFKEENGGEHHFGVFRLVILNFGKTIYEKFKSEDCPNQDVVEKMKLLSQNYTKRNLFKKREFEEENLWTLYALQEGVTSIPYDQHKRGNGSIRFIESFFNIKGSQEADDVSRMSIVSGKTRIVFDGRYNITSKINSNRDIFKVMTFNDSGNIEDKPDNKYVYCMDHYFPGTFVSAKILLNDDDLKQIKNTTLC